MNTRSITAFISLAILACIAVVALAGQEGTTGMPGRTGPVPGDFSFSGGSISEYTQAIRDRWLGTNIVVSQAVAEFEVPPMDLARVDPNSLLSLLEHGGGEIRGTGWMCTVSPIQVGLGGLLYHVDGWRNASPAQRVRSGTKPAEVMHVQSIHLLVENGFSPSQIIAAMDKAILADGFTAEDYSIQYDEPTKLLIMHGPSRAIDDAIDTLDAIQETGHPSES